MSQAAQSDSTMSALVFAAPGEAMQVAEVARPVAGAGQVLVRIAASGVNPLDLKIAAGQAAHAKVQAPAILGIDLAGIVEAVGDDVADFHVGDAVYGMTGGVGAAPGSLATHAAVDARLLAHKPATISMREAAALPLIVITAWEGLVDRARVAAGMKVLVQGGAGGVGHIAVQVARAFGAEVYATGSADQHGLIEALGATAIDRNTAVDDYVATHTDGDGFDIIYDTVGGATLDNAFRAARTNGGHVVSCLGWGTHALAPLSFRAATYSGVFTLLPLLSGKGRARHGAILREAAALIDAGKLKVLLDPQHYTLATVADAHRSLASGSNSGKLVIDID